MKAQLARNTLKYITSLHFSINPLSRSDGTRSMRLLLSSIPTKPPTGLTSFPETAIATTPADEEQRVIVTYSNKSKVEFHPDTLSIVDLIRKIEAPARKLRAKEEGV